MAEKRDRKASHTFQPFTLTWISRPDLSEKLLNRLNDRDVLILKNVTTPLSTGAIRYFFIIQPLAKINQQELELEAKSLNYLPLTLHFNIIDVPLLQQREYAEGLANILTGYLTTRYHLTVDGMEKYFVNHGETIDMPLVLTTDQDVHPDELILIPISNNNLPFYFSQQERQSLFTENYQALLGYDLISSDPLVWFYLGKDNGSQTKESKEIHLVSWHQMALIPISSFHNQGMAIDANTFRNEVNLFVASLRRDNIFTISSMTEAAQTLARNWGIDYFGRFPIGKSLDSNKDSSIYVYGSRHNYRLDTTSWFENVVLRNQIGQPSIYYLGGDWVQYIEPTFDNMARLQYAASLAYRDIYDRDSFDQVKCMPNLVISAPITSLAMVAPFERVFLDYIAVIGDWRVITCLDQQSYDYHWQKIQQDYPDLLPMKVLIPADPTNIYIVINNSLDTMII